MSLRGSAICDRSNLFFRKEQSSNPFSNDRLLRFARNDKFPKLLDTWSDVLEELKRKVALVTPSKLLKDLRPFIEDTAEFTWIERYKEVFHQLLRSVPTARGPSPDIEKR